MFYDIWRLANVTKYPSYLDIEANSNAIWVDNKEKKYTVYLVETIVPSYVNVQQKGKMNWTTPMMRVIILIWSLVTWPKNE